MLTISPEIIDGIIAIAYHRKWVETTIAAIRFSQCIVQGLWYSSDPYEQLPHLNDTVIQQIKSSKSFKSFDDFLRAPNEDKGLVGSLSSTQLNDLYRACKLFPTLRVRTRLFVEEDDEEDLEAEMESSREPEKIFEKDLVTIRTIMTRENFAKDVKSPQPVYAPNFPKTVFEGWWLILLERPKGSEGKGKGVPAEPLIHNIEKVSETTRTFKFDLKFMAPEEAGSYEYELHVLCDSYMGLDQVIPIPFTVSPASELPEYTPHPEDLELDNEPTLFEQMMAANADDDSSDDEDDKAAAVAGDSKKAGESINRQAKSAIYESDEDEDD
jgi:translocation protein SEC63